MKTPTAIEHLSLIEASCKFHVGIAEQYPGVYPPLVIAGWKSTLAAVAWAQILLDCTNELDAGEQRMINEIIAAWPIELLQ